MYEVSQDGNLTLLNTSRCVPSTSMSSSSSSIVGSSSSVNIDEPRKKSKKKAQSMKSFLDMLSSTEEAELNEFLAEFIFGCNLPFTVVESPHFKKFINKLRPSFASKIPSRKTLITTLLDQV